MQVTNKETRSPMQNPIVSAMARRRASAGRSRIRVRGKERVRSRNSGLRCRTEGRRESGEFQSARAEEPWERETLRETWRLRQIRLPKRGVVSYRLLALRQAEPVARIVLE